MKTINNELIRALKPCYDPSKKGIPENETLPVLEWVSKYRGAVPDKDIIWLLCHKEFMPEKELRLFAVWCAREALNLVDNPDPRSIEACNVAERYANGEATKEELDSVRADAYAARITDYVTAYAAASAADYAAACGDIYVNAYYAIDASIAAYYTTTSVVCAAPLDKLLTYFIDQRQQPLFTNSY